MKEKELTFAQKIVMNWYTENPSYFDTKSNNNWLLLYMKKWLGVQQYQEWFIKDRMAKMNYETFRRAIQWLIQNKKIQLSEENMKARHRSNMETRATIKDTGIQSTRSFEPVFDAIGNIVSYRQVYQ